MKRYVIAAIVGLCIFGGGLAGISIGQTTMTPLESSKAADAAAASAVQAAESNLTAAKATKAATAQTVLAEEQAKEPPKEEPPTTTAVVNASPTGPGGTWSVAFADAFAQPVGSTASRWHTKTNSKGCCNNSNETSTEVASSVHWSEANGLELKCEGLACSGVSTNSFTYALGHGASFVFETVARLPNNTLGGEDPAFWSISTTRWPPEADFFEYFGWGCTTNCHGGFPVYKSNDGCPGTEHPNCQHEIYTDPAADLGEQPWLKFHRYTTVVEGSTFTEYIDGKRIGSFSQAVNTDTMGLILVHALRVSTASRSTSFDVRSVAVYEDSAHAGQFVTNGGVATGTTVK